MNEGTQQVKQFCLGCALVTVWKRERCTGCGSAAAGFGDGTPCAHRRCGHLECGVARRAV